MHAAHGWDREAIENYHLNKKVASNENAPRKASALEIAQAEFNAKARSIERIWPAGSHGHYVEMENLAREYAHHRDEVGGYQIEGVEPYMQADDDWWLMQG